MVVLCSCRIFCADQKQGVSLDVFLSVVGQLKFRGTSVLFRLPRPPVSRLNIESTAAQLPYTPMVSRENRKGKGRAVCSLLPVASLLYCTVVQDCHSWCVMDRSVAICANGFRVYS